MRGAKSAKWVAGAIVVALAATACGGNDDGGDKPKASGKPAGYVSMEDGAVGGLVKSSGDAEVFGIVLPLVLSGGS